MLFVLALLAADAKAASPENARPFHIVIRGDEISVARSAARSGQPGLAIACRDVQLVGSGRDVQLSCRQARVSTAGLRCIAERLVYDHAERTLLLDGGVQVEVGESSRLTAKRMQFRLDGAKLLIQAEGVIGVGSAKVRSAR